MHRGKREAAITISKKHVTSLIFVMFGYKANHNHRLLDKQPIYSAPDIAILLRAVNEIATQRLLQELKSNPFTTIGKD